MATKYINLSLTKPDNTPDGIVSSTFGTGNYYGEATGVGEQVWRYETTTVNSVSTLVIDNIPASQDIDFLLKARVPHSDAAELKLLITDSANNGYTWTIGGGRVLFGAYIAAGTEVASTVTILSTYSSITSPFILRAKQVGTVASGIGWLSTASVPGTLTDFGDNRFSDATSRRISLRLTAPSSIDSQIIYDLHWVGIGTEDDNAPTFPIGGLKNVTGVVRDPSGMPVTQPYPVRLCHRATGTVLARGMTDNSGLYNLTANVARSVPCYVLSVDTRRELWSSAISGNV